jgi:putative ABC transport system ATP-binding protein
MLRLDGVTLTLDSLSGPVEILKGIDVDIPEGSTTGVTGPSGSGKSSLLAIMAGIERPTAGTIEIDGANLTTMTEDELALFRRDHIGIVFQAFNLVPTLTALENVELPLQLAGESDVTQRAKAALDEVGLGHRHQHYPTQLSGGEQQRVALARAVINTPSLLLADEPTGNLDGRTGNDIIDLMFRLNADRGTTLVIVTHDPSLAARCKHQVRIENGRTLKRELSVA